MRFVQSEDKFIQILNNEGEWKFKGNKKGGIYHGELGIFTSSFYGIKMWMKFTCADAFFTINYFEMESGNCQCQNAH